MQKEEQSSMMGYLETGDYHMWLQQDVYMSLYIARQLEALEKREEAYEVLKTVHETQLLEYDKNAYGIYEDYVADKVKFLEHLAALNLEITKDVKKSIYYIDEALDLLDGIESVAPYIDLNQVKAIKKYYVALLF